MFLFISLFTGRTFAPPHLLFSMACLDIVDYRTDGAKTFDPSVMLQLDVDSGG